VRDGPAFTDGMTIRLVSWNMAHRDLWTDLAGLDADVALLQEVRRPPAGCAQEIIPSRADVWVTAGWEKREWRTVVARLSDRVSLDERPTAAVHEAKGQADWSVSRAGTIAAADVSIDGQQILTAVSVYAPWEYPNRGEGAWADGSAHRILSDLAPLCWPAGHRVVVAGDWNILFGYGEHGSETFKNRYRTVFERAEALGLRFVGPQHPNGRLAHPWPVELPPESKCVPTFHHSRQTPATATRQLDFVFASDSIAPRVQTRALNAPSEWGPSDHCRVVIDVAI